VAIIGELIKARQEKGLSQKKLEEISGVKQPVIARMEKGTTNPNLSTIMKVLFSLGKTLYIGDLPESAKAKKEFDYTVWPRNHLRKNMAVIRVAEKPVEYGRKMETKKKKKGQSKV
jgi:transcriptional regulator with XRE-family HTH domain